MRVIEIKHEKSGHSVFCETATVAKRTLAICLREQRSKPMERRERVSIGYVQMSREEWDLLDELPEDAC